MPTRSWGGANSRIRPFFEQLGERYQQIEAVAMDMNTAFDLEVHCLRRRWSTTCSTWWLMVDQVRDAIPNALKSDSRWLLL